MAELLTRADALIEAGEREPLPGNPPFARTSFRARPGAPPTPGPGLYAIFLDGALVYLGIYSGTAADPFGGSALRHRWLKHVGTIGLRGRRLSVCEGVLAEARALPGPLGDAFRSADGTVLLNRGMEASRAKLRFAAARPDLLDGPVDALLARLRIGYASLDRSAAGAATDKASVKGKLSGAETVLAKRFAPVLNARAEGGSPDPDAPTEAPAVMAELQAALEAALV